MESLHEGGQLYQNLTHRIADQSPRKGIGNNLKLQKEEKIVRPCTYLPPDHPVGRTSQKMEHRQRHQRARWYKFEKEGKHSHEVDMQISSRASQDWLEDNKYEGGAVHREL